MVAHEAIVLAARELVVLIILVAFVVWVALQVVSGQRR
jgi:hypothetical protein